MVRNGQANDPDKEWDPKTEMDRRAVRQQLERILASPLFSHSSRYPALLRYVVEHTLQGQIEQLKERTLGMDVFGRDPGYDTDGDPVVRTTAAQVRRRLAEYYAQGEHADEVRIDLPRGAYLPVFYLRPEANDYMPGDRPTDSPSGVTSRETPDPTRPAALGLAHPMRTFGFAGLLIVVVAALLLVVFRKLPVATAKPLSHPTVLEQFWTPVLRDSSPVFICVGTPRADSDSNPGAARPSSPTHSIFQQLHSDRIAWPDAIVLATIAGYLGRHDKTLTMRKDTEATFGDLQNAAVVLIGGFNNRWLLRYAQELRFSYRTASPGIGLIEDRQNPASHPYRVDFNSPYAAFARDYGIVSRVYNPATGHTLLIASGMAAYGTIGASELLTNPVYMEPLAAMAPRDWHGKNVEILFSVDIVNGSAGPPHILKADFW